MKEINIVAAGPDDIVPDLALYNTKNSLWVGVDRGVCKLISVGIKPEFAFGDFDSVTMAELKIIEANVSSINKFASEKNETDLEIALRWAINYGAKRIRIFGATGGRLDHLIANVFLLLLPNSSNLTSDIEIIDKNNIAYLKRPGSYPIFFDENKKYVSFIPLIDEVKNLTLNGFKYPINNRHISLGSTLCISNELINKQGNFSFTDGILLIVRSSD